MCVCACVLMIFEGERRQNHMKAEESFGLVAKSRRMAKFTEIVMSTATESVRKSNENRSKSLGNGKKKKKKVRTKLETVRQNKKAVQDEPKVKMRTNLSCR